MYSGRGVEYATPQLVSYFFSLAFTALYGQVAVSALLLYNSIITLDKEVKYFWCGTVPFKVNLRLRYRGQRGDETELKVGFCEGVSVRSAEPGLVIAHVPGMKRDGPTLAQKFFEFDLAFDYAAPFRFPLPRRRASAAVMNSADPRTWGHDQTAEWLESEFAKIAEKRELLAVDVTKLLPVPYDYAQPRADVYD
ncbi:hypothetical protein EW145_g3089 [Phellinidium pouzarii]|uniref:Uncharacterized protein n=1 Tax=Phellinidium pouzarii TaxID=167371 RepID=A0A4S4L9X7_9AGAM|nr:hypothetical protein EW145_g3089 [Phellinidium pouzarii]